MTTHFDFVTQVQSVSNTFWNDLTNHKYEVSAGRLKHLEALHTAQYDRAVARYRAVLSGKGWCSTGQIECLLGVGETVANAFLRKLVKQGVIERRPRDGEDKYVRNRGWEYRWKQQP